MLRRLLLLPLFKWAITLGVLAALLLLARQRHRQVRDQRMADANEEASEAPKRAANTIIKLGEKLAESHGIKDEPALKTEWARPVAAYGRIVPNPRATLELRAPFAGTLRVDAKVTWPKLGAPVKNDDMLGWLDIRVGPQERLDLLTKLNEAKNKEIGAEELVKLQRERVARFTEAGKGVSQGELDMASQQLTEAQTQLSIARASVREWKDALDEIDRQGVRRESTWSHPIRAQVDGEITELIGRPGMAFEAGSVVARIVDFRHVLVRLEVPPEAVTNGPPSTVELFSSRPQPASMQGASNNSEAAAPPLLVSATRIGAAPQVDPVSQMSAYWYEADMTAATRMDEPAGALTAPPKNVSALWRPGLFVKALIQASEAQPSPAVSVAKGSLLYHQGRALVYVRLSPGRFERREVQVLGRSRDRWVLASGVEPGEAVVSQRAQVLLSEEFRGEADND